MFFIKVWRNILLANWAWVLAANLTWQRDRGSEKELVDHLAKCSSEVTGEHLKGKNVSDSGRSFPPEPGPNGLSWELSLAGREGGTEWQWLHYDLVHASARKEIDANTRIPEFARATLNGGDEAPRLITDGAVVAGVLPAYARTGDAKDFEVTSWHFAMSPGLLVTGRRRANRTLANLWEQLQGGLILTSPAELISWSMGEFARQVRSRLATINAQLDSVEDRLIEWRFGTTLSDLGGHIGTARREATRLKRVLVPLDRVLHEDADDLPEWTRLDEQDPSARLLRSAMDDISALSDRARSLQDELDARFAEETNRRLYIVSLLTALLFPATLVTGFFGMNTGGLPWGGDHAEWGTLYAALVCALAVLLTLALLRWNRLL